MFNTKLTWRNHWKLIQIYPDVTISLLANIRGQFRPILQFVSFSKVSPIKTMETEKGLIFLILDHNLEIEALFDLDEGSSGALLIPRDVQLL